MRHHNYPGSDLKFMVTTDYTDFHIEEDSFIIVVKNQAGRVVARIPREDCFWDSDGRFYFTLEHVQEGGYEAVFMGKYEDDDYDKQRAVITDVQPLTVVSKDCRCRIRVRPSRCGHKVHYEQVFTVSIDGDDYLAGSDGKYILTSDGKRIAFKNPKRKQIEDMGKVILDTMTGEEFKKFIEGRNPDGDIDTVPEMMDALQGISDQETIQQDVNEQIVEYMDEECATNDDIDEMF